KTGDCIRPPAIYTSTHATLATGAFTLDHHLHPSMIRGISLGLLIALVSTASQAQSFVLDLPLRSQEAEVSQRIGLTTIAIKYHRPLANGRKIWGGVVPYGEVWRTGANAITTISL